MGGRDEIIMVRVRVLVRDRVLIRVRVGSVLIWILLIHWVSNSGGCHVASTFTTWLSPLIPLHNHSGWEALPKGFCRRMDGRAHRV